MRATYLPGKNTTPDILDLELELVASVVLSVLLFVSLILILI
mgnify:FL=1